MVDIIMSARQMNVHYIYITYARVTEIEVVINDFATTASCNQYFPVQLPISLAIYCKIILKCYIQEKTNFLKTCFLKASFCFKKLIFFKERNPQRITTRKEFLNN